MFGRSTLVLAVVSLLFIVVFTDDTYGSHVTEEHHEGFHHSIAAKTIENDSMYTDPLLLEKVLSAASIFQEKVTDTVAIANRDKSRQKLINLFQEALSATNLLSQKRDEVIDEIHYNMYVTFEIYGKSGNYITTTSDNYLTARSPSTEEDKQNFDFKILEGVGNKPGEFDPCVTLELMKKPGYFITLDSDLRKIKILPRPENFDKLKPVDQNDWKDKVTWCLYTRQAVGDGDAWLSLKSVKVEGKFIEYSTDGEFRLVNRPDTVEQGQRCTFNMIPPIFSPCLNNCSSTHGSCNQVSENSKWIGTCVCNNLWGQLDCGAYALWPTYKRGMSEKKNIITAIQGFLSMAGENIQYLKEGIFDENMESLVKSVQTKLGLTTTGVVDPYTFQLFTKDANLQLKDGEFSGPKSIAIKALQQLLNDRFAYNLTANGSFQQSTSDALQNFQSRRHLTQADGKASQIDWYYLIKNPIETVGLWKFEGNLKSIVGGDWYTGVEKGKISYTNSICEAAGGRQALFLNDRGYVELAEAYGMNDGVFALTVEAYFSATTLYQSGYIYSESDENMRGPNLVFGGSFVKFGISINEYVEVNVDILSNTWHHIAGVYNGEKQTVSLYFDGKLLKSQVCQSTSIPVVGASPFIGKYAGRPEENDNNFVGAIDNLRISHKALNVNELLYIYKDDGSLNQPVIAEADRVEQVFDYFGEKGSQNWGKLKKSWSVCETGDRQSPINIPKSSDDVKDTEIEYIEVRYKTADATTFINGRQIGLTLDPSKTGGIKINNDFLKANKITFHVPSEHIVNNTKYDAEIQIFHQTEDDVPKIVVISLLVKISQEESEFFAAITKSLGKSNETIKNLDLIDVMPFDPGYYTYHGSLTTPPCTEGVRWIVMDKPISASYEQIMSILILTNVNARPVQGLNQRKVSRTSMDNLIFMGQNKKEGQTLKMASIFRDKIANRLMAKRLSKLNEKKSSV